MEPVPATTATPHPSGVPAANSEVAFDAPPSIPSTSAAFGSAIGSHQVMSEKAVHHKGTKEARRATKRTGFKEFSLCAFVLIFVSLWLIFLPLHVLIEPREL